MKGKPLTDLVLSACGAREAFVKKEFFRNNFAETWLKADSGLESRKTLLAIPTTSKRYMRLEGTLLWEESASLG